MRTCFSLQGTPTFRLAKGAGCDVHTSIIDAATGAPAGSMTFGGQPGFLSALGRNGCVCAQATAGAESAARTWGRPRWRAARSSAGCQPDGHLGTSTLVVPPTGRMFDEILIIVSSVHGRDNQSLLARGDLERLSAFPTAHTHPSTVTCLVDRDKTSTEPVSRQRPARAVKLVAALF